MEIEAEVKRIQKELQWKEMRRWREKASKDSKYFPDM